jgi:hypothetical protein
MTDTPFSCDSGKHSLNYIVVVFNSSILPARTQHSEVFKDLAASLPRHGPLMMAALAASYIKKEDGPTLSSRVQDISLQRKGLSQ